MPGRTGSKRLMTATGRTDDQQRDSGGRATTSRKGQRKVEWKTRLPQKGTMLKDTEKGLMTGQPDSLPRRKEEATDFLTAGRQKRKGKKNKSRG